MRIKFLEDMIYRASLKVFAWSLLRFDKHYGGRHQDLTSGCTFVDVWGKSYSFRWLLASREKARQTPSGVNSRFDQLSQRMDRAEAREKSLH